MLGQVVRWLVHGVGHRRRHLLLVQRVGLQREGAGSREGLLDLRAQRVQRARAHVHCPERRHARRLRPSRWTSDDPEETGPQSQVASLEPTFGGINLEDIKAPECFHIERKLRERMQIPVFHDDQHGTAIIVGAAVLNGLRVVGKDIGRVKLVCSGAGAAALSCLDLLVHLGLALENILVTDIKGVVYKGRKEEMDPYKERYAKDTSARTLAEVIDGADIFLGLSAPRVLKPEMVKRMAERPLILALANPTPEIMPEEAKAARPDCIIATGRSDYPNQVNNVLCFPLHLPGRARRGRHRASRRP